MSPLNFKPIGDDGRHPLARAPMVERANRWLEKAWAAGIADCPSLDPDALWAKAVRNAPAAGESGGRSAEDVADFRLRLQLLCQSLDEEAALNSLGRTLAHGQLVRVVRQRLQLGAYWRKRPELMSASLAAPILVIGQMRGGTTRIHRLLAADPQFAATRFCDSWNPVPERPDRRPLRTLLALGGARILNPWVNAIHPFGAVRPDEELGWLSAALHHPAYEAQWRIPDFVAFSEASNSAPIYREFARILATDAAHHANTYRPRIMKVPQFAEDLSALLGQFPNARLVVARRDTNDVLASTVSLVANQMTIQSDRTDAQWIEGEWRRKIALRERRMTDALASFAGPVAELDYKALDADWEKEIAKAYRKLGLTMSSDALKAMRREQGRAARTKPQGAASAYPAISRA